MGGQACVLYGAAEFSRDTDVVVLTTDENLGRLRAALNDLQADCIAVPPFETEYLRRGHAVHFRCQHPEARGMRIDVMSVLRGVEPFEVLWKRRTTVEIQDGVNIQVLALPDLVRAKKTQRDKDWPMIRRLVEANVRQYAAQASAEHVAFWLRECRTPSILRELAGRYPDSLAAAVSVRPLLVLTSSDDSILAAALDGEELEEREVDRSYWTPLRAELEQLRQVRHRP
jgi:hypothetical protein